MSTSQQLAGRAGRILPEEAASWSRSAARRYAVGADMAASAQRMSAGSAVVAVAGATRGLLPGDDPRIQPDPLDHREPRPRPLRPIIPGPAHP